MASALVQSLKDKAAIVEMQGACGANAVVALIDDARRELQDAA